MDSGRLEAVPPGTGHLDTVRALHQTVVSLRTALEVSKNELKELKQKYQQHSNCLEYVDVIEKLSLENHILRRKIIDSGQVETDPISQNIKLEFTYSPRQHVDDLTSEVIIRTATTEACYTPEALEADSIHLEEKICSTDRLNEIVEERESESPAEVNETAEVTSPSKFEEVQEEEKEDTNSPINEPLSQILSYNVGESESQPTSFKTKLELLSKFDVRIKVRTLKEGSVISSSTSETDSTSTEERRDKFEKEPNKTFQFGEKRHHFENIEDSRTKVCLKSLSTENITMAVPNEADVKSKTDKFDVKVRITSEENLVVKENVERSRRKDTLNLDVDDLSLRSLSEGDNSVFSEGGITPVDPSAKTAPEDKEQENASGNESEEVDDIELIFTTDESKDISNLQEDLVPIGETEHWGPSSASTHSTPVLVKFHTLDPDFQHGGKESETTDHQNTLQSVIAESTLRMKRVSLPCDRDIRHAAFNGKGSLDLPGRSILKSCDNRSDHTLYNRSSNASPQRLTSVDSLSCDYSRGLSLDHTKSSSFELGSSYDVMRREDSVDSFHRASHLGHRFSVFAETDISKCGISEEDLAANLNVRRNTCPNPFQYRPSQYRLPYRPGPLKASVSACRTRPVLRESAAQRRESGAQTDMSALPPRWTSDGYLAYKAPPNPCVGGCVCARAGPPAPRPARRSDDTRRDMLSDIGFTSMVPELSRSADPVWALAKRPSQDSTLSNTSKFLSRGSSYRSPCVSIDRSNDWSPQTVYVPVSKASGRPWRSSLPDVRRDDTDELLQEAETYVRRSIDNLRYASIEPAPRAARTRPTRQGCRPRGR